jgi:hypothetical protein
MTKFGRQSNSKLAGMQKKYFFSTFFGVQIIGLFTQNIESERDS